MLFYLCAFFANPLRPSRLTYDALLHPLKYKPHFAISCFFCTFDPSAKHTNSKRVVKNMSARYQKNGGFNYSKQGLIAGFVLDTQMMAMGSYFLIQSFEKKQ